MLGTILFVDEATGTAIIRADDGKRYRFVASDWPAGSPLSAGVRVDFDVDGDRALGPLPISEAVIAAVAAAPVVAGAVSPAPVVTDPEPAGPAADGPPPVALGKPVSIEKRPLPPTEVPPAEVPPEDVAEPVPTSGASPIAALPAEPEGPARPLSFESDAVPDYVDQSVPDRKGGVSAIVVVGGVVLLLVLAALAYMMWDNAETAGFAAAGEDSGASVSLYAQEDLPVRNVAAMTNATVLGRIARGDRVTGVEVPGSADANSRWLRIDGGNRFVPMTGLGPSAPPALPAAPALPAPVVPLPMPQDMVDGIGGEDVVMPDEPPPPPTRIQPPVRPSPPPERDINPSRPQETRPAAPQRPAPPQRGSDPRETPPVE